VKRSNHPADDRGWNRAEITNTTISWSFSWGRLEETTVLNRYSGILDFYFTHPDTGTQHIGATCQRTEPPRKRY